MKDTVWAHLNDGISESWASGPDERDYPTEPCPDCDGKGRVPFTEGDDEEAITYDVECDRCFGTGEIEDEPDDGRDDLEFDDE